MVLLLTAITLKMDGDEYDFPLNSNGENVLDAVKK